MATLDSSLFRSFFRSLLVGCGRVFPGGFPMNLKRFFAAASTFATLMLVFCATAFAADGAAPVLGDAVKVAIALSVGFGLGMAAIGGALGQGKAAAAALEGIGRNPAAAKELLTPLLLSLAIIESLVIYSLVISFMLLGKI